MANSTSSFLYATSCYRFFACSRDSHFRSNYTEIVEIHIRCLCVDFCLKMRYAFLKLTFGDGEIMKKIFYLTIFVLFAGIAFAERLPKNVLEMAREKIPEEAQLKNYSFKNNEYELLFVDDTKSTYRIEIDKIGNKLSLKEIKIESRASAESKNVKLELEDVESLLREKFPDVANFRIELEYDRNDRAKYEVEFSTDEYKAEIEVNPSSGEFCKQEFDYYFNYDSLND